MLTDFLIEGIDHIEIFVTDRVKSTKCYGEILGLKTIKEFETWAKIGPLFIGTEDRSVILAIMNHHQLFSIINRMAFRISGEKFMDFLNRIDNMELFFLQEKVTNKQVVDHDLSYSIYFDDPDGNNLELTCYDHDYLKSKIKSTCRFD